MSFVGIIQNIFYGYLKTENYILAVALALERNPSLKDESLQVMEID